MKRNAMLLAMGGMVFAEGIALKEGEEAVKQKRKNYN